MPSTRKAKRNLSNIDFSGENSHIALVSKEQGGPANGADVALVLKSGNFSQEFIEKVQQVQVTMELPDFLTKFFYVYGTDAEVLARMMGYDPKAAESEDESSANEMDDPEDAYEAYYEQIIQQKLNSFTLLKSLKESDNLVKALSELTEDQYLSLLTDQKVIENALVEIEKSKQAGDGSTEAKITKSVKGKKVDPSVNSTKENKKMDEVQELQKSLSDTKELLTKALADLDALRAEKAETIRKSRFDALSGVVGPEKAEVLFKALGLIESQEEFDTVLGTLKETQVAVEKSALFQEAGSSETPEEGVKESAVAKVLKSRIAKK